MPELIFIAVPDLHAGASSRVGVYVCEVKYSVMRPIIKPPAVPIATQMKTKTGVPVICCESR